MSSRIRQYLRAHVLGLVAIFIALSGTAIAGGDSASTSVVTDTKFKKLKKRVAALETGARPTGPAAGVLDGTYPGPGLADNSVGATEIIDGNVGTAELAAQSVTSGKFFANRSLDFDLGAQTAGNCTEFPFASAGVLPTDEVIVTPPETQPEGMIVQAQTSSVAGSELSMQVCAAETYADPPNATYEFSIIR